VRIVFSDEFRKIRHQKQFELQYIQKYPVLSVLSEVLEAFNSKKQVAVAIVLVLSLILVNRANRFQR